METSKLAIQFSLNFDSFQECIETIRSSLHDCVTGANAVQLMGLDEILSADQFVELIGELYQIYLESDAAENSAKRRDLGVYYTPSALSDQITRDAIEMHQLLKAPTFLEPAAGMGAFVFSYLRVMFEKISNMQGGTAIDRQEVLNCLYIVEKDDSSANLLHWLIDTYLKLKYGTELVFPQNNIFKGDALVNFQTGEAEDLLNRFNVNTGFDIILTNPPYRLLKATSEDKPDLRREFESLQVITQSSKSFDQLTGVGNLYKLFVCKIVNDWIEKEGVVGLVIPRSLLTDFQSTKLRKHIFSISQIGNIYDIPEGSSHFKGIGQAFSLFTLKMGKKTERITMFSPKADESIDFNKPTSERPISFYTSLSPESPILPLSADDALFLESLAKLPRVKDCPQIVNLRGELDITLDKNYILDTETKLNFIQGVDIKLYRLSSATKFVAEDFASRAKFKWTQAERIACQQISNARQERRLKWALVPKNHVLGNSCNFIAVDPDSIFQDKDPILTNYLLAVFNSFFMNRRFKLLSSNNHIANHEIAGMPFVVPSISTQLEIDAQVKKLLIRYSYDAHIEIERKLCQIFEIAFSERVDEFREVND